MIPLKQKEINEDILISLLKLLPKTTNNHSPYSDVYKYFSKVAKFSVENLFGPDNSEVIKLGDLGVLDIPFFSMGSINTTHLFGLDELILFSFYTQNKSNYRKVADLGANVGLHSVIMSNLGFEVTSYEPDLIHFNKIKEHVNLNCKKLKPKLINKAISTKSESVEFIRVIGNTTGSHIKGSKDSPYGELETITVETDTFKEIIENFDFLKIDIEGHEADVLMSTSKENWLNTDAMVEVGNDINAKKLFNFFKFIDVNLFSQKSNWKRVEIFENMPTSYKEGSLFISCKREVPWLKS